MKEELAATQKYFPTTLFNYIVQPDVKRCQKSREADPVLMNGNRWMRQRGGLPPRNGVAHREKRCQGKKTVPDKDEENRKNDEGVDGDRAKVSNCHIIFHIFRKYVCLFSKAFRHKLYYGRGCKLVYIESSVMGRCECHFEPWSYSGPSNCRNTTNNSAH